MADLNRYIEKGANNIIKATIVILNIGYFIDLFNFYRTSWVLFCNNLISITLVIIAATFFYFKKIDAKTCFGIIIYSAIANVFIDTFSSINGNYRIYFFLRDSIFIVLALTLASLIIKKLHAVIITGLYMSALIAITAISGNSFMRSSITLLILFVTGYAFVVYYFVTVVEKAILERDMLNATKNKFFSILAHDLKNPFTVLLGFSNLLEKDFDKLDDKRKKHYIERLNQVSKKTYDLLEDLLQWGRAQSQTIEYSPARIDLCELVQKNILLFEENSKNKDLKVVQETATPCFVLVDGKMLDTVIRNLLSNAIKFTAPGGSVRISCAKSGDNIVTNITDTGVGMDSEVIENMFRIDRHHSSVGTSGEMGTGMGLLICSDFIKKNKGRMWVVSEKGKGSTFSFSLPAC